ACRGWPATFSAPPDTLFIHVLAVTPHSAGGRKLCAALDTGDILHFRLRWHILKARVAFKDAAGICIHSADVSRQLICPIRAADDNHLISKAAETAQGKLAR